MLLVEKQKSGIYARTQATGLSLGIRSAACMLSRWWQKVVILSLWSFRMCRECHVSQKVRVQSCDCKKSSLKQLHRWIEQNSLDSFFLSIKCSMHKLAYANNRQRDVLSDAFEHMLVTSHAIAIFRLSCAQSILVIHHPRRVNRCLKDGKTCTTSEQQFVSLDRWKLKRDQTEFLMHL